MYRAQEQRGKARPCLPLISRWLARRPPGCRGRRSVVKAAPLGVGGQGVPARRYTRVP